MNEYNSDIDVDDFFDVDDMNYTLDQIQDIINEYVEEEQLELDFEDDA